MALALLVFLGADGARADMLSQLASSEDAARRNREASQLVNRAGNSSIGRGHTNMVNRDDLSLFEVVHQKYMEKQRLIFGTVERNRGVGSPDGY